MSDEIIRAITKDGFVKVSAICGRNLVQRARETHDLTPTTTAALGRTLCGASLLGELMKEENASLTLRLNGGGPAGTVIAVSDSDGNVRGYVANPQADLPTRSDGKLDVGGIIGTNGMLTVSRDIGLKVPYIGSTELISGEVAEDLAAYMVESEQIPAAVGLGVLVDMDTSVKAAGGFIVQLLPGAPNSLIDKLESNILQMNQLTTILDKDGIDSVVHQVLKDMDGEILMRAPVEYRCTCSRERISHALESCGETEIKDMIGTDEVIEVCCQFCDQVYTFGSDELSELLQKLITQQNGTEK